VELRGRQILVVGLARSGMAVARFARSRGGAVTATDARNESELVNEASELRQLGAELALGGHPTKLFTNADLIVLSPGVPSGIAPLESARRAGVEIISEVDLAARFLRGRLIGITGSNGKTTTTALTAHLLRAAGIGEILVGGNIGFPLTGLIDKSSDNSWAVAELSSFQLETSRGLRANVAVVTNISPDHLDRHPSFEDYVHAKERVFLNQTDSDYAVLNGNDTSVMAMRQPSDPGEASPAYKKLAARRIIFSSRGRSIPSRDEPADIYLRDGKIFTSLVNDGNSETEIIPAAEIPTVGMHNVENVMAALGAVLCATGARARDLPALREAIKAFKGVEHRIEFVATVAGVKFYNDSKATNVDSTVKALQSFDGNIIVILGGKDKGSDYTVLAPLISERVKQVILIGAASDKIADQLQGAAPMIRAESMADAVRRAADIAVPGDTVLLAPACASFDMFENYEHRGRVFKEEVGKLTTAEGSRTSSVALEESMTHGAQRRTG
jgi:UDP-N-acetylmuramoylalanine--D-glutamate ligase